MEHEHDYRKLSNNAVFCRGCGDIKSVAPAICTLPHYPVYPYVPSVTWPWSPYRPWNPPTYRWDVSSGTVTNRDIEIGNTVYMSNADFDQVTKAFGGIS
jgi:hypothetical protein